jgi:hypothetical protein
VKPVHAHAFFNRKMAKITATPASSSKAVSGKPESVVSAYLAYSKSIRADVKRSLPGEASGADIMRAIGSRWKSLSKEEKKPFVNQRNAWLFCQGRTPKNLGGASRGLPAGWVCWQRVVCSSSRCRRRATALRAAASTKTKRKCVSITKGALITDE